MNNQRTVSDTKRSFYKHHTRPVNSIYRRVVEELMVEMHLLSVNNNFSYDPIYALGVVTSFDQFMSSYQPTKDVESIFTALCNSVEGDAQKYRQDAENILNCAQTIASNDLVSWLVNPMNNGNNQQLVETVQNIINGNQFKYSRLFAIGLYTILEKVTPDSVKEEGKRQETFKQISEVWHLPLDKLLKDLELYRSNLDKLAQMQIVIAEAIEADRKKREQRNA